MRIRLKVIAPGGGSRVFEHEGEAVQIGRDPSCELLLDEDEALAASRLHARIDLSPSGATVSDLGSSNKTQLNEEVVTRATPLRPGDRIQIGFTGAQMVVLDLDVSRPAPVAKPGIDRRVLLVAGVAVAAFVVVGATLLLLPKGKDNEDDRQARTTPPDPDKRAAALPTIGDGKKAVGKKPDENGTAGKKPDEGGTTTTTDDGKKTDGKKEDGKGTVTDRIVDTGLIKKLPEVRVAGNYLVPEGTRPSVLLQRLSETHAWTVLRSGESVSTGHALVSLPGYESVVALQSGVRLNLWGSLPQFESPVNESVVVLRVPEAGVDADILLDRGRIEIGNHKPKGECVVRVSFASEDWTVTLKGPKSRVVVELITRLAGAPDDVRVVGLFSQGDVMVKTRKKEYTFAHHARLAWISSRPDEVFDQKLSEAPAWWAKPVELSQEVKETLLFLKDWSEGRFHAPKPEPDVTYAILVGARDSAKDPKERELGLWFLAALDAPVTLIDFLRDPDQDSAAIRTTAMMCLQDWIRRNGPVRSVLVRQLQQRFSYPQTVAEQVVRLLAPIPEAEREKAATYQELIDLLDHDDPVLRHLAFWQLYQGLSDRRPEGAKKIRYDPMGDKKERQAAMEEWRRLVPAGTVPPRRAEK